MEIFRSVTQTVLGSPQQGNQPTGAETVERLVDRVQSSTLLEDRRDGCRALKSLSRKFRLLVGAHAMDTLIQVLESDRSDHEIVNYALETLVNVTSNDVFCEDGEDESPNDLEDAKIGEQFTEIFIKRTENVSVILSLMDEFDFKVRFPAMKLLNNLLVNRPKELQEAILVTPNGVSKLMDMLSDSREVIRNDTLLLLTQLTKGNTNLQKIVVFENAFDHLFEILREEGFSEGGVVVGDCLILMLNLLRNNPSNQTLFKEGNYIQKISEFFDLHLGKDEVGWPAQKVANVRHMLKLLRTLVSPQNSAQLVSSCQEKVRNCNLLEMLCNLFLASGIPTDILTDSIITVSEIIRGNQANQEYFSSVNTSSRPAIVLLLMSMVNEKQPFMLRCAVLYCFQSFLYRNPCIQAQIVQTLLPQTTEANQVTAGHLLCGGLLSQDPVSNWFSSIALSHALIDNTNQKEELLRVQLVTVVGSPPVSLLQQCTSLLQGGSKLLTRLGILQLLCTWLANCPLVVSRLLTLQGVIPHLTAYLSANEHDDMELTCQGICSFLLGLCAFFNDDSVPSFTREALIHLVSNRVGLETFADKMENILRSEGYLRAAKSPELVARHHSDLVFDHEFTKLFKGIEASVLRAIRPQENGSTHEIPSAEVIRYKDIIRDQDQELTRLRQTISEREAQIRELQDSQDQLKNRLKDLENKNISDSPAIVNSESQGSSTNEQVSLLQQQLTEMTYARDYYYYQMVEKDTLLQKQGSNGESNPEMENLRKQLEDLQLALYRKDEEIGQLKDDPVVRNTSKIQSTTSPTQDSHQETLLVKSLREEKNSLESSVRSLEREKSELETRVKELETRLEEKELREESLTSDEAIKKCIALESEMARMQSEEENLLVLLTDQETKISEMKRSLRKYGEIFSDDDDDDDDDEAGLDIDLDLSSDEDDDLT